MKFLIVFFMFLFAAIPLQSQQSSDEREKMENELIKTGYLRKEGNNLIFKVEKASDTPRIKVLYINLFNQTQYTVSFEVDGKYFQKSRSKDLPPLQKQPASVKECITDFNTITAERFINGGKIKIQGNKILYYY